MNAWKKRFCKRLKRQMYSFLVLKAIKKVIAERSTTTLTKIMPRKKNKLPKKGSNAGQIRCIYLENRRLPLTTSGHNGQAPSPIGYDGISLIVSIGPVFPNL